jgi:hypothetical protein
MILYEQLREAAARVEVAIEAIDLAIGEQPDLEKVMRHVHAARYALLAKHRDDPDFRPPNVVPRKIVSEEWHRAVKEFDLKPGGPTETVVARIINRLDGTA